MDEWENKCSEEVCTDQNRDSNSTIRELCNNGVIEKSLPATNEIYISNKFGTIKKRLTFNNYYEGEIRVSPDGKNYVYSSYVEEDMDYELFEASVDGNENSTRVC